MSYGGKLLENHHLQKITITTKTPKTAESFPNRVSDGVSGWDTPTPLVEGSIFSSCDTRNAAEVYPDVPSESVPWVNGEADVPSSPGVYFIRGEGGCVEYIGQSVNMRQRVCSRHDHLRRGDRVSYLEFGYVDLLYAEAYYIGVCRPKRNFAAYQASLESMASGESAGWSIAATRLR